MDPVDFIAGLMRENYPALGFIPDSTIRGRYVYNGHYILQNDERGRAIGYLLHGPIRQGQAVYVSQHCIQYEKRLRGYGERAFAELLRRANLIGASSIRLRCADDLPALKFWQAMGFQIARIVSGGKARERMIAEMIYPMALPLFGSVDESSPSVLK